MKKIIALALSVLLGSTGYVIVDHTLEERVKTLEGHVESLNIVASSLEENHLSTDVSLLPSAISPTLTSFPTTTTTINYREGYNYGYLKIRLPDYGGKTGRLDQSDNSWLAYMERDPSGQSVILDGTEVTVMVLVKNNSTGELWLNLSVEDSLYYDFCKCTITEQNGKIYLDDITYFDLSGLTTTTTTTTRTILDVTTK